MDPLAGLVCATVAALGGWFVPLLIARLPEPEPEPDSEAGPDPVDNPKELYADLAALPWLPATAASLSAVVAGVLGLSLGWVAGLLFLVPLVVLGTALSIIDVRTWLLPTKLVWPTFGVVLLLGVVAAALEREASDLIRALLGSAAAFAFYFILWLLPGRGMGFGDVRLSAVLGFAMAWFGWPAWVGGLWVGFVLGGAGWIPLRLLGLIKTRNFPFGPFMCLGAVLAVGLSGVLNSSF